MGYGYGVGFIRATSDIPIKICRASGNGTSHFKMAFKILGTNTSYQVPTGKTAKIALERSVTVTNVQIGATFFGYADDDSGTNFVILATINDLDIATPGNERYWILDIPSNKFPAVAVNPVGGQTGTYTGIIVLFEV
jgi:hypothetical protein